MENKTAHSIKIMALKILRPLVRILIRQGIGHRTLEDYVREAYVLEGEDALIAKGSKATISSIAVLTGLSRKEVRRIKDSPNQGDGDDNAQRHRIVRLLGAWSNEINYSVNGHPRALPISGEGSFAELVKRFSGDMTPVSTLNLLEQSGNVIRANDELHLVKKHYLPMQTSSEQLDLFGTDVNELMETIAYNFTSDNQSKFFQRKVSNALVSKAALAEFRHYSSKKSMSLLEDYDEWLSKRELSAEEPIDAGAYVAVGIYYVENAGKESEE